MSDILSKPINPLIRRSGDHYHKLDVPHPIQETPPNGNPCGEVALGQPVKTTLETFSPLGEAWPFQGKENAPEAVKTLPAAPPVVNTPPPLQTITKGKQVVELKAPETPKLEPKSRKTVELAPPAPVVPALSPIQRETAQPVVKEEPAPVPAPVVVAEPKPIASIGVARWDIDEEASTVPVTPVPAPAVYELTPIAKDSKVVEEIPTLNIKRRDVHGYVITGYDECEDQVVIHGIYLPDELNRLEGRSVKEKLEIMCVNKFYNWSGNDSFAERKAAGALSAQVGDVRASSDANLVALVKVVDNDRNDYDDEDYTPEPFNRYTFRAVRFKMNDLGTALKLNFAE